MGWVYVYKQLPLQVLYVSFIAVIGFEPESIQTPEDLSNEHEVELTLLTPTNTLSPLMLTSMLEVTVEVNQTLSSATFGNPL